MIKLLPFLRQACADAPSAQCWVFRASEDFAPVTPHVDSDSDQPARAMLQWRCVARRAGRSARRAGADGRPGISRVDRLPAGLAHRSRAGLVRSESSASGSPSTSLNGTSSPASLLDDLRYRRRRLRRTPLAHASRNTMPNESVRDGIENTSMPRRSACGPRSRAPRATAARRCGPRGIPPKTARNCRRGCRHQECICATRRTSRVDAGDGADEIGGPLVRVERGEVADHRGVGGNALLAGSGAVAAGYLRALDGHVQEQNLGPGDDPVAEPSASSRVTTTTASASARTGSGAGGCSACDRDRRAWPGGRNGVRISGAPVGGAVRSAA